MSEISELEGRVKSALERIARGVDALNVQPDVAESGMDMQAEVESLRRALEHEANTSAQLEERLKEVTSRQTALEEELAAEKAGHQATQAAADKATADVSAAQAEISTLRSMIDDDTAQSDAADERIEALTDELKGAKDALEAEKSARVAAEADALSAREMSENAASGDGSEPAVAADQEALEQMAHRLRRMRRTSQNVRGNNRRLRAAVEDKVVDAELINEALRAELDSLSAQREAELDEAQLILTGLQPLLADAPLDSNEGETPDA